MFSEYFFQCLVSIGGDIDQFDSKKIKVKTNVYLPVNEFNAYSHSNSLKSKYS